MKKIVMLLVAAAATNFAVAQNAKVTTAGNYLRQGDLMKAKAAIDEAAMHEKTKGKAKTEVYRGKVYFAIAMDTTAETASARPGALDVSKEAFIFAKKNDDGRINMGEVNTYLMIKLYNAYWNNAASEYKAQDFANASNDFASCGEIKEAFGDLDTNAFYYAGNAALAGKDNAQAIMYFNKIKDTDYESGVAYAKIASAYLGDADTTNALAVISEGRTKFPSNQDLLIKEFNLYVEMGKTEEAIANIDQAIAADPTNDNFIFVRGKLKETNGDFEGAVADYKKAIEVNPNSLDANHELGALYVNSSRETVEKMNALPLSAEKEYDALKAQLDETYKKALPYLEKAYELDPENQEVKSVLMQLYSKVGMLDKYQELKDK